MSASLPLPVTDRILTFPEYRMGVYKVALVMKDGSVIEDVIVAWGDDVIRVGGVDGCPIDLADVIDAKDRS